MNDVARAALKPWETKLGFVIKAKFCKWTEVLEFTNNLTYMINAVWITLSFALYIGNIYEN